jgi:hypothetical protein
MPTGHGDLAGHQQRSLLVAVFNDLQQVASLLGGERLRPPVIDDEQPGTLQRRQHPRQPAFAAGGREFCEQPWRAPIEHREAFPAALCPSAQASHDLPVPVGPPITRCWL